MKKVAPSVQKAQALQAWLQGEMSAEHGSAVLSTLVRLATERVLQDALEQEQAEELGRDRYERTEEGRGHRNGYEPGTLKTAEGVLRVQVPQIRGQATPYRSRLWDELKGTSEVLRTLIQEMYVNGLSQRDIEATLERALGQFVVSRSTISAMTETLVEEYQAFRQRDLSGYDVAYLFIDTVYEPLRRWGSKTGVLCVWGICEDGRKVLLSLWTTNRESYESCVEVLRDLIGRGLRTPITITTDGAVGLTKAVDAIWPHALRIRCWFHKMRNLMQKVPPQAWPAFKALVADLRDAPTVEEGERRLQGVVRQYQSEFPEACRCLLEDRQASLNHLKVPLRHRQYVRTSNLAERAFEEERRRTKVIPHLWDEDSLVKLVFGTLMRVSERWGKKQYSEFEQQQIRILRRELGLDTTKADQAPQSSPRQHRRSAAAAT